MAGIIYELVGVLEQENECYEGLETLATYTENAVVNKNIEFLQEVVKTQEEFVGRLTILNRKRENLMKDIAIVTGMNAQALTITQIIDKVGAETEIGVQLTEIRNSIQERLAALRKQSEFNKQLLTDSLDMVDFTVNALRGNRGYGHIGNYSRPGEDVAEQRHQSMFDYRQ